MSVSSRVWLLLLLLAGLSRPACAQDEPADPETPPAAAPEQAPELQNPVEFLGEPATPEETFERIQLMMELARPEIARVYLQKLLKSNPSDETLLKLREKYGPAEFLKLANIADLRPQSTQLLELTNRAFARFANDPGRISGLITALGGDAEQRSVATVELQSAGVAVVPALLRAIADPKNAPQRDRIVYVLVRIGEPAVPILIGALGSTNEDVRAGAVQALGYIGSRDAVPYLWYPAYADDAEEGIRKAARQALGRLLKSGSTPPGVIPIVDVVGQLKKITRQHLQQTYVWPQDADGRVHLWVWNDAKKSVEELLVTPRIASLRVGTELARQSVLLAPDDTDGQVIYLSLALTSEAEEAGWDQDWPQGPGTAHDLALSAGPDIVRDVVAYALQKRLAASAIEGLGILGQIGSVHQLTGQAGSRPPVLAALEYPDPRVQFAAANAILQLDPRTSFTGAERVVQVLARALADGGEGMRRAVVVDAFVERGNRLAGFLGEMGYEVSLATTGREGFKLVSERPDVDLVLLHGNVIRWGLSETLANFRADSRTAATPICIYGEESYRAPVQKHTLRYADTTFFLEPANSDALGEKVRPFLASLRTPALTEEQRAAQARLAAAWLAFLAQGQRTGIYPLATAEASLLVAVENPALTEACLLALGALPSLKSQERLAAVALDARVAPEFRTVAATQLAFHIQRFSLLLPKDTVTQLHAAWKESEAVSPELHTALGSVIGSLKPDPALVSRRIREFRVRQTSGEAPAPAPMPEE